MSKSIIKRMREAEVSAFEPRSATYARLKHGTNDISWWIDGEIEHRDGWSVSVYAEACHDGTKPMTNLSMDWGGRSFYLSMPHATQSEESIRRLAVAFAARVMVMKKKGKIR